MDTRWTGVAAHTLFHDGPGTRTWNKIPCWVTALRHKGQSGASLRGLLQREVFTGLLWF